MSNSDHLVEQGILIHKFELEKIFKTQSLVNSILDYSNLTTDGIYPYYLAHIDKIDEFLTKESNAGWQKQEFPEDYIDNNVLTPGQIMDRTLGSIKGSPETPRVMYGKTGETND